MSHGHRFDEVIEYTIGQMQTFVKSIEKLKASDLQMQLAVNATAAQGDESGIKKMQKTLSGDQSPQIPDDWITKG